MTSLFGGGTAINVNASGTLVPQSFTPTDGQTLFNITLFSYTVGTNSLIVFINGIKQRVLIDFVETSTTSFTLTSPVLSTDVVEIIGFPLASLQFLPDSSIVTYLPSGVGAVTTTVQQQLRNLQSWVVNVKDAPFYAKGDGTTDDTAAIQAALNSLSSGGVVYLPAPTSNYKLTAALNISVTGISLVGANKFNTKLIQSTLSAKIINCTVDHFTLDGVYFGYSGTPVAGGTAIYSSGSWGTYKNFWINECYVGINLFQGVGNKFNLHDIRNYVNAAFIADSLNDVFVSNFIYDAANATNGALGGIRLTNKCEAAIFVDGDVINGVYNLTTDGTYTIGNRPAYCRFTNVYFDSAAKGSLVDKLIESSFNGCWWSAGRSGTGFPGLELIQTDSLKFSDCDFFNNGLHGVQIDAGTTRVVFTNCSWNSNSVTAGAGVGHGVSLAANVSGFSILGGSCTNGLYTGVQQNGIFINTGCSNYSIIGVNVNGNNSSGISDNSVSVTGFISKCPGYVTQNKGTGTINVGQTVVTITHGLAATPNAQDILVGFGTNSAASSGVTSLFLAAIGATTFQIVSNTAVTSVNLGVTWQATIKGA
jgi:hypothetical protein